MRWFSEPRVTIVPLPMRVFDIDSPSFLDVLMRFSKLLRPDRRGRFIAAHRRFIGQSQPDSFVNGHEMRVAYPLLRVEITEVEVERVRGLPPGLLRPPSIEPLDL